MYNGMTELTFADCVGKKEVAYGRIDPTIAAMLHATTAHNESPMPETGEPAPQLWHWAAFNAAVPMSEIANDGHPKLGSFLPPVPLDRRMWAAGSLRFIQHILIGEELKKSSEIIAVKEKSGSTGNMVFVTVKHEIEGANGCAIRETQDIVYLKIPREFSPPKANPAPDEFAFEKIWSVSEALLFRYSAITFNAHRIHYDLPYSTKVEKYPGLVVHAPLQATLLIAEANLYHGSPPSNFSFRGVHPVFHFEPMRLIGEKISEKELRLCTASPRGHKGLVATATWGENR